MSTISATFRGKATIDPTANVLAIYSGITGVASSINTMLLSYTVPVGKTFLATRVEVNGSNIAIYQVLQNASIISQKRTYFGGGLSERIELECSPVGAGLALSAGDVLEVMVEHFRPSVGDFDATLVGILLG